MPHNCNDLVDIFNQKFLKSENTQLIGGADEPLYQPANDDCSTHTIYFTKDYFSSALHEIAHWCVAGQDRRKLVDYGYWYAPDGRSLEQQAEFERVEIKPQAIEWIFSLASNKRFLISADNLESGLLPSQSFKNNIHQQAIHYLQENTLPERAALFTQALTAFYNSHDKISCHNLRLNEL